ARSDPPPAGPHATAGSAHRGPADAVPAPRQPFHAQRRERRRSPAPVAGKRARLPRLETTAIEGRSEPPGPLRLVATDRRLPSARAGAGKGYGHSPHRRRPALLPRRNHQRSRSDPAPPARAAGPPSAPSPTGDLQPRRPIQPVAQRVRTPAP